MQLCDKINARFFWMGRFLIFYVGFVIPVYPATLRVGFASADITPDLKSDVWLAGYGWNRKAQGVHDPIYCRVLVLQDDRQRIALASIDTVGLQYPAVQKIRKRLPEFRYVMISSTHNHEGPDTIGIWGKTPFHRGTNDKYMSFLENRIVTCIMAADQSAQTMTANYGVAAEESLLRDSREPIVKDGNLRALRFLNSQQATAGILVQWNCHPEALGPQNRLLTADFPYATISTLQKIYGCPVVYFSGALGGLMAPPKNVFQDEQGKTLREGEFAYAEAYGKAVAELAKKAVDRSKPITLTPFQIHSKDIAIPVKNPLYRLARLLGVVRRTAIAWTGDFETADQPIRVHDKEPAYAIRTEVGFLRLGELSVACIPGEIYPELVYGNFQEPADPNVDFVNAPLETPIAKILPDERWLLFGLANDEIGYIIPKRQWDRAPPYAYGRSNSQYGEINSCGPHVAEIISQALQKRVNDATLELQDY